MGSDGHARMQHQLERKKKNLRAHVLKELRALAQDKDGDHEANHGRADDLLLELIDDDEVTDAFKRIKKWYA